MKTGRLVVPLLLVVGLLCCPSVLKPLSAGAATPQVVIDADPATPGIQSTRNVTTIGTFQVAVVVSNVDDLEAFNFEVTYDKHLFNAPTTISGLDLDRNPDANQTFLTSTGRSWYCSPPPPVGDDDPSPTVGAAFISCYSTGAPAGPNTGSGSVIATVRFSANMAGTSSFGLRNVNLFKTGAVETGSCNPVVITPATCTGASLTASVAVGGIAEPPDTLPSEGGSSTIRVAAIIVAVSVFAAAAGTVASLRRRTR